MPSTKVYENKAVYVFAPLKETVIAPGHMLVIPKKHYDDLYEIKASELAAIMRTIKVIAERLRKRMGADGLNILHASGKSGQQSIGHFHIHLIPRFKNDGLDTWPKTGYREKEYPQRYLRMSEELR